MKDTEAKTKKNVAALKPSAEIVEKMRPIARTSFGNLLKRAIIPPAPKPAPKST